MKFTRKKTQLALPRQRLAARVLDLLFQGAPIVALGILGYFFLDIEPETAVITTEVAQRAALITALFAAALIINIVQWMLIASRGQSLGKMLLHIQIVDEKTHKHAGIVRALLLRTWLNALLDGSGLYILVDCLLIFREDRKTLHDHIARTVVITV